MSKKLLFLGLIFTSLNIFSAKVALSSSVELVESSQNKPGLGCLALVKKDQAVYPVLKKEEKKKARSYIKSLAIIYLTMMLETLVHELGHALVGKLLFNYPINITIGSNDISLKDYYRNKPGIRIVGLSWGGFTHLPINNTISSLIRNYSGDILIHHVKSFVYKQIAIVAAGPIAEIIFHIILKKFISKYLSESEINIFNGYKVLSIMENVLPLDALRGNDGNSILNYISYIKKMSEFVARSQLLQQSGAISK